MTVDLWFLVAVVGLQWTLIMADATPNILRNGMPWALGNRDGQPPTEAPAWHGRLNRASGNLAENLPLFAVLVLVVHVSDSAGTLSLVGCAVFLSARLAHAMIYVIGVPLLRTGIWAVSIVGMGMIVAELFV